MCVMLNHASALADLTSYIYMILLLSSLTMAGAADSCIMVHKHMLNLAQTFTIQACIDVGARLGESMS